MQSRLVSIVKRGLLGRSAEEAGQSGQPAGGERKSQRRIGQTIKHSFGATGPRREVSPTRSADNGHLSSVRGSAQEHKHTGGVRATRTGLRTSTMLVLVNSLIAYGLACRFFLVIFSHACPPGCHISHLSGDQLYYTII